MGIGYIKRKGGTRADLIIAMFWSLGMALGILFIAMMPGYPPDMDSYLFGSILSVTRIDLTLMICLTVIVALVVLICYQNWKAYLFDDEFASIIGLKTAVMEYTLLVLTAMTVVVLIKVVGIILVLALLTAPAAASAAMTSNLKNRIIYSIIFGIVFCLTGLWISYELNIASGAAIVTLSVVCCLIIYAFKAAVEKVKKRKIADKLQ